MSTLTCAKSVDQIKLDIARRFTAAYRQHMDAPVAIREAMCMAEYFPAFCADLRETDLIAGQLLHFPLVGFGLEQVLNRDLTAITMDDTPDDALTDETRRLREKLGWSNCGFVFHYAALVELRDSLAIGSPEREEVEQLIDFWMDESSQSKYRRALTDEMKTHLGRSTALDLRLANSFFRLCCYSLDHDKLLQLGIPGLRQRITERRGTVEQAGGDVSFHDGLLIALDVLTSICEHYAVQADELADRCDGSRAEDLRRMADVLRTLQVRKPDTLHEAIQLFWIYNVLTDVTNFGRMDIYLGDFYARDLDRGTIDESEARRLLTALWTKIADLRQIALNSVSNSRIIVGGRGRRNEANADRFALAAMDVAHAVRTCEPNLTLRFYKGQNPALMERALDLIGDGCVHPGLYNDDVHIPMVREAYNVPLADAEQYVPEGCGELLLDHMAVGSPNNILNYLNALDLVLHNGIDTDLGERRGLAVGELSGFDTFEKLVDALKRQVAYTIDLLARRHALEVEVHREAAAYLFVSMLSDDCIDRGRSLFDDGARYLGGIIETFGLTNVVDSLYAIREVVYEKRQYTLPQLVRMLDANFEGHEAERHALLRLPKYGNDHDGVDELYVELNRAFCGMAMESGRRAGLHFFLNCNLNPGAEYYKHNTKASADGRVRAQAMAYGNAPTAGNDRSGLTALLNSMARNDAPHAGYVQNLKVAKDLLRGDNREKFRAMIDTYFDNGGCQLMITALDRGDLEDAMVHPENYRNLIVRIAGITMKFVELSPDMQREVINRTFYA